MTIKKIQTMSLSELRDLAIRKKIVQAKTLTKSQLLDLLSRQTKKIESVKVKGKASASKKTVKKAVKSVTRKAVKKSTAVKKSSPVKKKVVSTLKKTSAVQKVIKKVIAAVKKTSAPKKAVKSNLIKKDLKPLQPEEGALKTEIFEEKPATINHHENISAPVNAVSFKEDDFHFPDYYEKSGVISMARDPRWMFTYWTIVPKDMETLKNANPTIDFGKAKFTLRVLDSSNNAQPTLVQEIHPLFGATSYYVNVPETGKKFSCEIGFTTETGEYLPVAKSNTVDMPSSQVSQTIDNSWINQENYQTVFNLGTEQSMSSHSMSSQAIKNEEAAFSGVLSSQALSSGQISSKEFSSQALGKTLSSETLTSSVLSSAILSSGVLSSGVLSSLVLSSQSLTSSVLSSETLSSQVLGITTLALSSQQLSSYSLSSQVLTSETLSGALSSGLLSSFSLSSGLLGALTGLSSQTMTSSILSSAQVGVLSLETLASGLLSSWGLTSSLLSSMETSSWLSSGVLSSGVLSSMALSSGEMSSFQLSSWALPVPEEFLSSAAISSNSLSSGSLSSSSFGVMPSKAESGLSVNSEVIVYGKAEPGSMLLVGGVPKKAGSDGSFSARFLMQEGTMNIPVKLLRDDSSESDFIHVSSSHSRDYR